MPCVVATAGPEGRPSARAVVVEHADARGFVFWSSAESPKGRDLAANPRAALVFLWPGRQVRVEGRVEAVGDDENARHWQERDGKRQLAAFRQSEPVASREALEALLDQVPDEPERPAFWIGYRVLPELVDIWVEDGGYVHDRCRYTRTPHGWDVQRLQP